MSTTESTYRESNYTLCTTDAMQQKFTSLFSKKEHYIPRVAAVHDLCGYGKCSLGVAIPLLSAAGCDVCPVPTSLFSAHTKYEHFYMHDTTSMLKPYLSAWKEENVEVDAVYSGFLGAAEQVQAIQTLYTMFPQALRVVDPVMGDGGKRYPTYTQELCDAMKDLAHNADILTPNLTEAAILTDLPYEGQNASPDSVKKLLHALSLYQANYIILKGIETSDGKIINFIADKDGNVLKIAQAKLQVSLHGTGDLFASCVLACCMNGKNIVEATEFAGEFVCKAINVTQMQPDWQMRGVSFESLLGEVTQMTL